MENVDLDVDVTLPNDIDMITSTGTMYSIFAAADENINGIDASGISAGRSLILYNSGSTNITLKDQAGASTYQFDLTNLGGDIIMAPGSIVSIVYDGTFWRVLSYN